MRSRFGSHNLLALGDDDYTKRPFSEHRAVLVDVLADSGSSRIAFPCAGGTEPLRPLGYELTGDSVMSVWVSQTCRPPLVPRPRHHAAFHAIRAVVPRFVHKSVHMPRDPITPADWFDPSRDHKVIALFACRAQHLHNSRPGSERENAVYVCFALSTPRVLRGGKTLVSASPTRSAF